MTYKVPAVAAGALRLHYNENTAGCSPAVRAALESVTRETTALYPDYAAVTAKAERWFGVEAGCVQLTNGLDEGILLVAQVGVWHGEDVDAPGLKPRAYTRTAGGPELEPRAYTRTAGGPGLEPRAYDIDPHATPLNVGPGLQARPEIIIVEPAFEVYEDAATIAAAALVRIAPKPDFAFPLDEILAAIGPATRVIYLTDPNNPTGLAIPDGAVERIAAAAPGALVLVDEAYSDFSGRTLIGPLLAQYPNLVVGRTFAKGHGLAGLRIGALVAQRDTLDRLRRFFLPFTVNTFAVAALSAALDDRAYLDWYVAQVVESRARVYAFCEAHSLKYWPSETNFVLVRFGDEAPDLVSHVRDQGILLRDKSTSPGCAGCIRITAGIVEHTAAALTALEAALASRTR